MAKQIIPGRVCVVGATGRIGSLLVRKLLERGHVVHATLRHLCDPEKTGLLKSFPGADERLVLFEADLLEAHRFEQAVRGCEFVFFVAFPMKPIAPPDSKARGDPGEALVAALQAVLSACERSGTVRRLVYTGSVSTASPLEEDGLRFRDFMDESCWTRPDVAVAYSHGFLKFYVLTKTEFEKQLVSYGDHKEGDNPLEVVILTCGLIGGEALVDNRTGVEQLLSPLTGDAACFGTLKSLQDLMCSVPLVHLEDVCEAHLFCMDVPLTGGRRFLCARGGPDKKGHWWIHEAKGHGLRVQVRRGANIRRHCSTCKETGSAQRGNMTVSFLRGLSCSNARRGDGVEGEHDQREFGYSTDGIASVSVDNQRRLNKCNVIHYFAGKGVPAKP